MCGRSTGVRGGRPIVGADRPGRDLLYGRSTGYEAVDQ
jgi:hypothetical protein